MALMDALPVTDEVVLNGLVESGMSPRVLLLPGGTMNVLCRELRIPLNVDKAAALDAWRRAEPLLPRDYDLLFNVGMVLSETSTPSAAIPYLRRFVQEAPPARYAGDIARVRQTLERIERGAR